MRISDWSSDVCSSDLVKRRQPEAQNVGRAEIGDDVEFLERLHDLIALRMRIGDLAAARRMVLRAHQLEAISLAQRLHPLDEQIAERERLAAHLGHVDRKSTRLNSSH